MMVMDDLQLVCSGTFSGTFSGTSSELDVLLQLAAFIKV